MDLGCAIRSQIDCFLGISQPKMFVVDFSEIESSIQVHVFHEEVRCELRELVQSLILLESPQTLWNSGLIKEVCVLDMLE